MLENPRIGSVLRLDDYGTKSVIQHYDLGKPLARGTFSAVFEGASESQVFKLTTDPASYESMSGPFKLHGPYALKVFEDEGDVGEQRDGKTLWLVTVERLVPLDSRREYAAWDKLNDTLGKIKSGLWENTQYPHEDQRYARALELLAGDMPDDPLKEFIEQLSDFCINVEAGVDFHSKNVMKRPADGHHVASDPVFSIRLLDELKKSKRPEYFQRV